MRHRIYITILLFLLIGIRGWTKSSAQDQPARYDIGAPTMLEVWVDPLAGSDSNGGASRSEALATLTEAWNRIPIGEELNDTGYHIMLMPGLYSADLVPNYWESRYGTAEFPIMIEAAQGVATVTIANANIFDTRYLYFINIDFSNGADAFHCEHCDHLLIRGATITGAEPDSYNAQETLKVNQSQYVYIENSDISGAWDNAVDFVAVQYGHFIGNRIHNAGDWCFYLKGGSAYFRVEANQFYDCGTGGFTAGQGTGFQFMTPPWLQYEAYDIEFVNNIVHDVEGAGAGVQGGYNILIAHNIFYRVGERSHLLEIGFGSRSCDGQAGDEGRNACDAFREAGGWGNNVIADGSNYVRIPNRHVYIYNNIFYNPDGYQSQWQQFAIPAPFTDEVIQAESNVPLPAFADDDLQIHGNIIWNGTSDHALGIESDAGCETNNPTCNIEQLRAENSINTVRPQMVNPDGGEFELVTDLDALMVVIPVFPQDDRPTDIPESP